jgi:N4-gp56 family major capsid protein
MAQNVNTVAARASAFLIKDSLEVADYSDVYGMMGASPLPRKDKLPMNKTKTVSWRRYELLPVVTTPSVEGVTPDGNTLEWTDVTATLQQFIDYVYISDLSMETVEDALMDITKLRQNTQCIRSITQVREGVLIAGDSVSYSTGTSRVEVDALITKAQVSRAERTLDLAMARKLTNILKASTGIDTHPIPACYIGVCSPYTKYDFENSIGESGGYTPKHKYGTQQPINDLECGTLSFTRFLVNPDMQYFASAGAAKGSGHKSTDTVNEDVFATLIFAEESYGIVSHGGYGGLDNVKFIVKPLGAGDDPANQRASSAWKMYEATKRLNELWMFRLEHGVTA